MIRWKEQKPEKRIVMEEDVFYMQRCLQLARLGRFYVAPNPMVGAVLVREIRKPDGTVGKEVVGEGWHRFFGGPHAEVGCFRDAEERGCRTFGDCTLYVSLEPCCHYGKTPPCALLIREKGVRRVVVGMQDPNPQVAGKGLAILREAGIEVTCGILEDKCRSLNRRFVCLHEKHRPYVTLKWAQSADGFLDRMRDTDNPGGGPVLLSSPLTKQLVHRMRACNMAIMVGTRTALLDNPRLLTTRWSGRNPVRIVPDRHHVIPADSRIFSDDAQTGIYDRQTDFPFILSDLASRGVHSLLIEGGAALFRHILETDLWDEMQVEVAPVRLGGGVPAPSLPAEAVLTADYNGHRLYRLLRPRTEKA